MKLNTHRGLTRIEVAVVAGVVLLAIALAVPFLLNRRGESRRLACEKRLIDLTKALHVHDDRLGAFPGYRQQIQGEDIGWVYPVLVYMESATERIDPEKNATLPEVLCPAIGYTAEQLRTQPLSYVANCGLADADVPEESEAPPDWPENGLFFNLTVPEAQRVEMSLAWLAVRNAKKGTLLFSENVDAGWWTESSEAKVGFVWVANMNKVEPSPEPHVWGINRARGQGDGTLKFARPSSEHAGGVNASTADGGTTFLSDKIDYVVYAQLMTPDDEHLKTPGKDEPLVLPWK